MTARKRLIVIIGIIISAVFLFLAFRGLNPEAFLSSLGEVNPLLLGVGAAIYAVAVLFISWRWQFLLRAVGMVRLPPLMRLVAIGYMGNNVYPLRAGEALRLVLLKRNHNIAITGAATTIAIERILDGIVLVTFVVVGLLLVDVQSEEIRFVATYAAPLFIIAILLFFALALFPGVMRALVRRIARLLPLRMGGLLVNFLEDVLLGLEGLRSPFQFLGAVIGSYLSWLIEAGVYWIVMWAFGLEQGYDVALLVTGTVNLAGVIPASPGQIGVYEFFVSAVMVGVGVAEHTALAYAVVVHIVIWLPVTLAGFIFLAREGLGWSSIIRARELETRTVAPGAAGTGH